MTIKRIVDPAFTMKVEDPKLAKILEKLNKNKDEEISLEDFRFPVSGASDDTSLQLMRELVVGAFAEAGYFKEGVIGDIQKSVMLRFFSLSKRFDRFASAVPEWIKNGTRVQTEKYGSQLRLNDEYCSSVGYAHTNYVENIEAMTNELAAAVILLSGIEFGQGGIGMFKDAGPTSCGKRTVSIQYNESTIPPPLREHIARAVNQYLQTAAELFKYDSIACAGDKRDPNDISGQRNLSELPYLRKLQASPENKIEVVRFPDCPPSIDL